MPARDIKSSAISPKIFVFRAVDATLWVRNASSTYLMNKVKRLK